MKLNKLAIALVLAAMLAASAACGKSPLTPDPIKCSDPKATNNGQVGTCVYPPPVTETSVKVMGSLPAPGGIIAYDVDVRVNIDYVNSFGDVDVFAILSPVPDAKLPGTNVSASPIPISAGKGNVSLLTSFGGRAYNQTQWVIIVFAKRNDRCFDLACSLYHQAVPFEMNYQ